MSDFSKLADGAKQFACGIYKAQPGALVPTLAAEVLHLVWDNFCGNPPSDPANLPPPPAPPFKGGQCQIQYYINFRRSNGTDSIRDRGQFGPIKSIKMVREASGSSDPFDIQYTLYVICFNPYTNDYNYLSKIDAGYAAYGDKAAFLGIEPIPSGGVTPPDNCGDLPGTFPPSPPPPPDGYTSPPTAINFNDNSTHNYTYNFKPPVLPPSGFIPPIVINVANATGNFKFPMTFNFNGSINFGSGGDFSEGDRNDIKNINNNTNNINSSVNNVSATTNKTNNTVNNFVNTVNNKPPDPTDYNPPSPSKLPGEHEVSYLAAVEITLTAVPINLQKQRGNNAPDVLYAGWFEFMRAGKALPRQPIHFEKGVFLAPSGVDGYAYTLYTGVQGQAVEITKKEKI